DEPGKNRDVSLFHADKRRPHCASGVTSSRKGEGEIVAKTCQRAIQCSASRSRIAEGQCFCAYQPRATAKRRTIANGTTIARKTLPSHVPWLIFFARRASAAAITPWNAASERIAGAAQMT